ncbi:ABC transporter permease subunit [Neomegalonema perideroedes]|uniref:ABC transporter permease subunit n=1 Tax=Neomegalonema perideroedes TaxID=217219 RepID=UPI000684A169|nr:ABC transporter permease subunit [Neomegalonema perideroedes]
MLRVLTDGRRFVIALPMIWLLLFFLAPFLVVFKVSVAEQLIAQPPYSPLFTWAEGKLQITAHLENYQFLLEDRFYIDAYWTSIKIAAISTFLCLLVAYPMAYAIARSSPAWRNTLLMLVILPFWTSFLLRVYAWIGILSNNGVINNFLMWLGVIDQPIVMMQTNFAVYVGIVYSYLPLMILPLYTTLEKLDGTLLEASADLGAGPIRSFLSITLPLSLPGILAGCLLVFIPAVGEYVIPALLGPSDTLMIGRVLWDEFFTGRAWPIASAVAIAMLLFLVAPIMLFRNAQGQTEEGR